MWPIIRQLLIAVIAIVAVIILGSLGYIFIEGWDFVDALYMCVITVTTVGYGEVHSLSHYGQLFTIALILSGFGIFAFQTTKIAQIILEGNFREILWKRKMKKEIDSLKGHYIICGFGRVGQIVCEELADRDIRVVVCENDPEHVEKARQNKQLCLDSDVLTDEALLEAGVKRAAGLITVLSRDSDNLLVALSARELNPNIHIIARGESEHIEAKLIRAGADTVISPFRLSGEHIAEMLLVHGGAKSKRCIHCTGESVADLQLRRLPVTSLAGKTVNEVIKLEGAISAVSLIRQNGETITPPSGKETLLPSDELVMVIPKPSGITSRAKLSVPQKTVPTDTSTERTIYKIVVADDHAALRKLFAKKIRSMGHDVLETTNGTEAIELIDYHKPVLVVLDAMMPGCSGYDVCTHIRNSPELEKTRVSVFSNQDEVTLKRKGAEVKADKVILKSASSQELTDAVQAEIKAYQS